MINPAAVLALLASVHLAGATPVSALAFSPDGGTLASNGNKCVVLRSPTDGSPRKQVPCALARVTSLVFHPAGEILAAAGGSPGESGGVVLLDWKQEMTIVSFSNATDVATSVAFSPDGHLLAVASADQHARVYRLAADRHSCTLVFTLTGHAGPVLAVAFSPNGRSLVTGSGDRSVKVWSAEDGKLARSFTQHTEAVQAVAFRPLVETGDAVNVVCASGGDDQTVRIWQPEIGRMVRIVRKHDGPVSALGFSPDGKTLFSAGKEGIVRRIASDSDEIMGQWHAHADWIYSVAVSPDGSTLATGDWSGEVKLWGGAMTGGAR